MEIFKLIVCCLIVTSPVFSQRRVELEKRKYKTQQEIEYSNKLLEEVVKTKKETVEKLAIISYQIEKRSSLINNLSEEVEDLEYSSVEYQKMISAMTEDLEVLRAEYKKILRYSSLSTGKTDLAMFLLASESFSQAYKRYMYVKRYSQFRLSQMNLIENTLQEIEKKNEELVKLKHQKSLTIAQKEKEAGNLKNEVRIKGEIVSGLVGKEKDLRKRIKDKERIAKELQEQIEKVLEEERLKMKVSKKFELSPEEKLVNGDFLKNKGRLPWPLERAIITGHYGNQAHPLIKNTFIPNNGIDFTTESGSYVRALYEGIVTKVVAILGANYTVIIKHGNFYTVYQNLIDVQVKKGEKVKALQRVGVVNDGRNEASSVLHLEIWQNFERMNPEEWLAN
jgi:murein hydrolase activator